MFHEEFYPTPKKVIARMLQPFAHENRHGNTMYRLSDRVILEPSAGKGDILDFIKDSDSRVGTGTMYCCELNPDLQMILRGKGYAMVGEDFLEYQPTVAANLILMNPPFSNGDEHLLHAWNMLEEGDIACLLNAETINNPHTRRRKLLAHIVKEHGSIEDLGSAFTEAERATNVGVALVRLHKETKESRFQFFEDTETERTYNLDEETIRNQVARRDVIGNMVLQYEMCKEIFVEYIKLNKKLHFYMKGVLPSHSYMDKAMEEALREPATAVGYSVFVNQLNSAVWKNVVDKTSLKNYMTRSVSADFDEMCKQQGTMAFTENNVQKLLEIMFFNQETILEKCLVEAFDLMRRYDEDNTVHWEGWKTNDAYKVNRKIIVPYLVEEGYRNNMTVRYDNRLDDIDRAMCLLTGQKFAQICGDVEDPTGKGEKKPNRSMKGALNSHFERNLLTEGALKNNTVDSEFFTLKYFKKGTLHMYFKDVKLWERFNLAAAKGKNWLPA